jgi:hypothetical protein
VADRRELRARLPPVAALLLLPVAPTAGRVLGAGPAWEESLLWWGLEDGDVRGPGGLVVAGSAPAAAASGAETVLLTGGDRSGALRRAGYAVRTWTVHPAPAGAAVAAVGDGLRRPGPRRGVARGRALAVDLARGVGGRERLHVASRVGGPPALAALAGGDKAQVLAGGGGPRRRPVILVAGAASRSPSRVVKAGRAGDEVRAAHEQAVLERLHGAGLGRPLPRPLGTGRCGPFVWSAESAVAGAPLADLLGRPPRRRKVLALLEDVAAWLTRVAVATATARSWAEGCDDELPLVGEHARLAADRARLSGVPAVLVHGDLGSAFNLLVDGRSWTVVDWETARPAGPPLTDLLPLVCGALASLQAPSSAAAQARYVLRLCAGREEDSAWLHRVVDEHLRAVRVPADQAGTLAALAFGHQASTRLRHELLVRAAGDVPPAWRSPWDDVVRGWQSEPGLGADWSALRRTP